MVFGVGSHRLGCLACWIGLLAATGSAAAASHRVYTPEFEIQSWTAQDGLPDDSVSSIQQTQEGFLWVGTARGLARFDGWSFAPVFVPPDPKGPTGQVLKVTAQCVDPANRLWFGTEGAGLFRLNPQEKDGLSAELVGLAGEKILCLGVDKAGAVWVGTERGLLKWEGGRFHRLAPEPGLADPAVLALQITRSNGVWISTRTGLRKFQDGRMQPGQFDSAALGQKAPVMGVFEDRRGSLWVFGDTYLLNASEGRRFNYFRGGGAALLQVWSICEGRAGQLWIGTSGQGLFHFGGSRFRAVDMWEGRGYSEVRAVFLDRQGHLWVGTQWGLVQLRERTVRWFESPDGAATSLTEDPEGRVWAGFEHGGLAWGRAGVLERAGSAIPLADQNLISSLFSRGDGSLWVGTLGSGLYRVKEGRALQFTTAHGLTEDTLLAVCGAASGRVWVATGDGRLHCYFDQLVASFDSAHGLTGHPVSALAPASDGGLWLGTAQGELLRFQAEQFRPLPPVRQFAGKAVSALGEDSEKRLWVGSRGGGIGCLSAGQWQVWNSEAGLPDNTIIGIQQSSEGALWVATARGVCRLPANWLSAGPAARERLPILVEFPPAQGEEASAGWPRSLRSRDGLLWFATERGVVNFNPTELQRNAPAPKVRLETLRANGQLLSGFSPRTGPPAALEATRGGAPLRLPAGLRDLEIGFTAPSLAFPERTLFRHQLEGFDPEWQDSSTTRRARYGRLPAGEYRFRVTASDAEGGWSGPETHLSLVVPLPAWRSPWGLALQGLGLITAAASVARVASHRRLRGQLARLEQQRAMERERARIAQDMHDELGAKLTKISFLSERARNDLAGASPTSAKLDSIALTSRQLLHSLDEIVWAVNPQNDTLEHLVAYLGQYAAEYLDNTAVEHELQIPRALPQQPLSAEVRHNLFLAFEEALGNALKHSGASRVRVVMSVTEGSFGVEIWDNGRGLNPPPPASGAAEEPGRRGGRRAMGLSGMRERLAQSGGLCDIQSPPGEGTRVILSIPLGSKERKES